MRLIMAAGLLAGAEAIPAAPPRPNIVSFLIDDLGYHDRGSAGNNVTKTPNIDAIYAEGVDLTRYYAYKYCSPSRRAFVAGRWPTHLGEENQKSDLDLRMKTLGDKLSGAGYHTVLVGKTHWNGQTDLHLPYNRGFQSFVGFLGGGEAYWSGYICKDESTNCGTDGKKLAKEMDMWHDKGPAEKEYLGIYSTQLYTQLAIDAIHNHSAMRGSDNPLWIHLCYQAVHNPQTTPPGLPTFKDDDDQVFYQVLESMDEGIGNVTSALRSSGMWDNTLVIFASDNGGADLGNNYPFRGGKYSPYEGGVRVMAGLGGGFVPKAIQGTKFGGIVHVSDWFPTLCVLAGADPTDSPPANAKDSEWFWPIDGVDVWPFVTGANKTDPRENVPLVLSSPYTSGPGGGAMVIGKYKIVYMAQNDPWHGPPEPSSGPCPGKCGKPAPKTHLGNQSCVPPSAGKKCLVCSMASPCLYDLENDERELNDIAKDNKDMIKSMNKTYTDLVFNARQMVPINFTKENGWDCEKNDPADCKGVWGCFNGPNCICPKGTTCKLTDEMAVIGQSIVKVADLVESKVAVA